MASVAACALLWDIPVGLVAKRRLPPPRILMTDAQVRDRIIKTSIAIYPGDCACPYSIATNGRRCGRTSIWSRRGDFAGTCFPNEVSPGEIREWRVRHQQAYCRQVDRKPGRV